MNLTRLKTGIWQAELKIPKQLHAVLGKQRFARSTRTKCRREATLVSSPWLAEWQSLIQRAQKDPLAFELAGIVATPHLSSANKWDWFETLKPSEQACFEGIEWGNGLPLPVHMEAFAAHHYKNHKARIEARRYILEATRFMPTTRHLRKEAAQRWLFAEEAKPEAQRRAVKTMQKALGYLSEYVAWLQYQGLLDAQLQNPFRQVRFPKALKRPVKYSPMTDREILAVRTEAQEKGDAELVAYIDIARYTGMRLSEIGALTTESLVTVEGVTCFKVKEDAKTQASSGRVVPVAAKLHELLDLGRLNMAGRSNAVGKRFGRLKRDVLADGQSRTKCFHSIRKFVVTTLEQAGIAEGIAADLVGHEKPNITYNVYSGGSSVQQLTSAITALEQTQSF
jgi:integrase